MRQIRSSSKPMAERLASLVLCFLGLIVNRVIAQQCTKGGSKESILGWKLQGHVFKAMMVNLGFECLLLCHQDNRCQSFNWVISLNMCEFSDRTKEARPKDFVPDLDRYYYYRRDMNRAPLGSIPELSAETCKEIKASEEQAVSKKYWLSTIKPGVPVLAYCDMKTQDADECTASPPVCDFNSQCANTRGSFSCTCNDGYSGDGKTCQDVDECIASPPVCDVNAQCDNTRGSFSCTCKDGYSGDGKTCQLEENCDCWRSRSRTPTNPWGYSNDLSGSGNVDAINFQTDGDVILSGYRLWGVNSGSTSYMVTMSLYRASSLIANKTGTYATSSTVKTFEVYFTREITIHANVTYTAAVRIVTSAYSHYLNDGMSSTSCSGVTVTFTRSPKSTNGSGVNQGQIPALILRSPRC